MRFHRASLSSGVYAALALVHASAALAEDQSAHDIWLEAHNDARAEFGSEPLRWNSELEREALEWAKKLAAKGRLVHSAPDTRQGQGENLWMGTSGYFSPSEMIAGFVSEKRHFRAGQFPKVSTTGKWSDVGHYTQIVWRGTREVGCAKATAAKVDVLVCRYWPAGNVIGTAIAPSSEQLAARQ